jgi:hypothetical protein
MEEIAFDAAKPGAGVIDESRPMGVRNQAFPGCPDSHGLGASGVTRILMGLHDSCGDEQIRLDRSAMQYDRHPSWRDAKVHQGRRVLRFVVDHSIAGSDPGSQLGALLIQGRGPVHPGSAKKRDVLVSYSSLLEFGQQSRDQQVIRAGAGCVGEHNTGSLAAPGEGAERWAAEGMCQRLPDGSVHIRERLSHLSFHHCGLHAGGNGELNARIAIGDSITVAVPRVPEGGGRTLSHAMNRYFIMSITLASMPVKFLA